MHHAALRHDAYRARFVADDLSTASPARVLVMCFDRLDRDLLAGLTAIDESDHFAANDALGHAQDLINELVVMLDVDAWEHAGSLLAVYDYLLRLLAIANAQKAPSLVREAQRLTSELGDAFRAAAADGPARDPWSDEAAPPSGISVQA